MQNTPSLVLGEAIVGYAIDLVLQRSWIFLCSVMVHPVLMLVKKRGVQSLLHMLTNGGGGGQFQIKF